MSVCVCECFGGVERSIKATPTESRGGGAVTEVMDDVFTAG